MRTLALALVLVLPAAAVHADVVQDARSATAACLSAVIDGAPVGDVTEGPISIRRGVEPVSCTVSISDGQPVVIHEAVMTAIKGRTEMFAPAKTRWDADAFASREAFCNLSLRRNLNVVVSTAKPGVLPVLVATVSEAPKRDDRCDRDKGLQKVAAGGETPAAAANSADEIVTLEPKAAGAPAKSKRWKIPVLRLPTWPKAKN